MTNIKFEKGAEMTPLLPGASVIFDPPVAIRVSMGDDSEYILRDVISMKITCMTTEGKIACQTLQDNGMVTLIPATYDLLEIGTNELIE